MHNVNGIYSSKFAAHIIADNIHFLDETVCKKRVKQDTQQAFFHTADFIYFFIEFKRKSLCGPFHQKMVTTGSHQEFWSICFLSNLR